MPELDPKVDPNRTEGRFSGIHPDNTYPLVDGEIDEEQQRRLQARQEHDRTPRESSDDAYAAHPPLTERFTTNDHAARRAEDEGISTEQESQPDVVA